MQRAYRGVSDEQVGYATLLDVAYSRSDRALLPSYQSRASTGPLSSLRMVANRAGLA